MALSANSVSLSNHGRLVARYWCNTSLRCKNEDTVEEGRFSLEEPEATWSLVTLVTHKHPEMLANVLVMLQNTSKTHQNQLTLTARLSITGVGGSLLKYDEMVIGEDGIIHCSDFPRQARIIVQVKICVYEQWTFIKKPGIISDLSKLLHDNVLTDVVLQVEGGDQKLVREFGAHKAVLAARSPVFQRLFQTDMAEAQNATVKVGFSAEVVESVLRYVYTDKLDLGADEGSDSHVALDVVAAADYYQLQGLKDICEAALQQRVANTPVDVLETIVLADRYGLAKLKEAALNAAASSMREIQECADWALFLQNHHGLVGELIKKLTAPE